MKTKIEKELKKSQNGNKSPNRKEKQKAVLRLHSYLTTRFF
jgi:hypothetical protein